MVEGLKQGNLSDCCRRDPLILMVQSNLFNGHDVVGELVSCFVDYSICALAYFVDTLVALHLVPS
jgi:hypothetical protein